MLWFAPLGRASYIQGIYSLGGGGGALGTGELGAVIPSAQSVTFTTPEYHFEFSGGTYAIETFLSADLAPGSYHALASTAASISGVAPGGSAVARSSLYIDAFDILHFESDTLAAGTDVTFRLTATLHSILDSNVGEPCPASFSNLAGYALFDITNSGNLFFPAGTLYHDTCGSGSEVMTASVTRHTTVGADYGLNTLFRVGSASGVTGSGATHSIVDAGSTGTIFIEVLTPGVTFFSDSGALYSPVAPVPEPHALLLMVSALAGIVFARRKSPGGQPSSWASPRRSPSGPRM